MPEEEARHWPDLMSILEDKVKPIRASVKRDAHRERWWRYGDYRPGLYQAIRGLDRVLVISQVSKYFVFAFLPTGMVYSHRLYVVALDSWAAFAMLQSSPHDLWARFFGSTLEDRPMYATDSCFETFPFPESWASSAALREAGRAFYEFRAGLMVRNAEGLTKTYNRFHDPDEREPVILKLRELHDRMDRAVLDAYGWTDLRPTSAFFLDHEEEEVEDDDGKPSRRKKPWRYRWPDELRDDVLARLLALNDDRSGREASCVATGSPNAP
jgi:hypothetical protein